jgi:hypothetical protein
MDDTPDCIAVIGGTDGTAAIGDWWRPRWLSRRIFSDSVLAEVAQHTLVRPVRHGAGVLPPPDNPDQLTLFEQG